jgi:hypothetical protein
LPERFFLIKHTQIGAANEILSINGQINPMVQIRPGEMQCWRIGHVGATLFIKFRLAGMPPTSWRRMATRCHSRAR